MFASLSKHWSHNRFAAAQHFWKIQLLLQKCKYEFKNHLEAAKKSTGNFVMFYEVYKE